MTTPLKEQPTIWSALNDWAGTLPDWQRFIISHAVRDGRLSDELASDAYALFLREAGLDSGTETVPILPATVTGRVEKSSDVPLSIVGIKNPKHINALPQDAALTFCPSLTIIYGHNGAGKSGFARLLSSACFSRSKERILPNVYSLDLETSPASADIVVQLGNEREKTIQFTPGVEDHGLRRINVFNSSIARIHLSEETPLGFKPVGFDVFDEVARVIGEIVQKVDQATAARSSENKFGRIFIGESDVAQKVNSLSKDSKATDFQALAVFGEAETLRLAEIGGRLVQLRTESPEAILKALDQARKDVEDVQAKISNLSSHLNLAACQKYAAELALLREKTAAALAFDPTSFGSPTLKKIGSPAWVGLMKVAREVSKGEEASYPTPGDACLLCHRPLDEPSASLIKRFWGFLDDQTRNEAEKANEAISSRVKALKGLVLELLAEDSRSRSDLQKTAPTLVPLFDALSERLSKRRDAIVATLDSGEGDFPASEIAGVNDDVTAVLADIAKREVQLREGSVDEAIKTLDEEHILLRHRQVLHQNIDDIVAFIANEKWADKARQKKRTALTTRFVTDKQKELFATLIEGRYKTHLKQECENLKCSLPVEFKTRGSSGQTLRGLKIAGNHKPSEILSEGEQRAVALADFLTEVILNPASAGIVLDDPVTSMDHRRKRLIADRLAQESKARQVIIFTHDLVFLQFLMDAAESTSADFITHWVSQSHDGMPGVVTLNECPANSSAYKTTHRAREALAQAKKVNGQQQIDKIRGGAAALRNTLEEIVIRDLFKGAVQRWDEQVRLSSVTSINWSNEIADEISALQGDISRLIEAHSTSDAYAGGMPEIGEFEPLILRVEAVQARAKQKRK
ncbi:AAA family ATPase [Rhizobium leguminosarum]|uniref:AAA family ATPase n=1 Tax=Rhizobium leguminosarum TaxID=384 RepID=UPI001C95D0B7|nr:AAA family ATPase [Rhizobium leguminosarum]MBY5693627.1 AAA family ATPase [Rhizobium leguminosarum]